MGRGRIERVKIRVLEILATLKRAGAERMAVSLASRLDASRFESGVVSLFDPFEGGLEPELGAAGVPVWHLGKRPGLDVRMIGRLRRVMREFRPTVVQTHSYVLRYSLPAAAGLARAVMVHTVHNVAARETDFVGRTLHRAVFGGRVAAVAVGEEVRRSYREWYGQEPAATIRNGIETSAFHLPEARRQWRAANGFRESDFLAVSVGRLDPQKNPVMLVEAFGRALGGVAGGRLLLVGQGSLRGEVAARARELGLAERVNLLGVRPDVAQVLAASDLFVMASDWEGTPLAVMEAMAAGLPVVATAVGGVPELVKDGETGLLCPAGDLGTLAEEMGRLARDGLLRRAMGCAGLARSAEFSVDRMVAEYAALFERLTGGRR
jgi:glycosyltransferase involved in cell wall biosynthesis